MHILSPYTKKIKTMPKHRRSSRIRKLYGKKRKKIHIVPVNIPNELIEHIIRYIPFDYRGSISQMSKYWNNRTWKIPVSKHTDNYQCTCRECFENGFHSLNRGNQCPCPLCMTNKLIDVMYNITKESISKISGKSFKNKCIESLDLIYNNNTSNFSIYRELYELDNEVIVMGAVPF